jgi:NADPH-dependent ferric siderophore reductase
MASSDPARAVRVERVAPLCPTMRRVTFSPEGGAQPPDLRPHGVHCRLLFPDPQDAMVARARAFTYRRWHADGRFDVDFVVHGGGGPAARWLGRAGAGDIVGWRHGGPPKVTLDAPDARASVLVADATALPLVSALVERAHPRRAIRVFLLLGTNGTPVPEVLQGRPVAFVSCRDVEEVEARLRATPFSECGPFLAACEADAMRRLRRLVLQALKRKCITSPSCTM